MPAQAQAGGWQFDHFECTGSTQWGDSGGTHTALWADADPRSSSSGHITFGSNEYGFPCQSVGTICAVFTWTGGGQAPDSLMVLISSGASVHGTLPVQEVQ